MSALDPAILRALDLPPSTQASVQKHGGSGFSSTFKVTIESSQEEQSQSLRCYFLKTARGVGARDMFAGEHASLSALHAAVPSLCPASYGTGTFDAEPRTSFLVTDFIEFGGPSLARTKAGLAAKLAQLHATPAPTPDVHDRPMFGFPVTTCCGDTPQPNHFESSWATFFAEHRLKAVCSRAEQRHGVDPELRSMVQRMADRVVPRLLGDGHLGGSKGIVPVVVHGDLWAGNQGVGRVGGAGPFEELVFDPSSCYAHSEFDLGIMRMFGGFSGAFMKDYHNLMPKTEPVAEYEDRLELYELYHHLNHTAIFERSYRSGSLSIMKRLWSKYGK